MKRIVFFVTTYWELHWFHNVIETLNANVYTVDATCLEYCKKYNFNVVDDSENHEVVVVSNVHYGQQNQIVQRYISSGKKAIVIQHGWDPAISLYDNFWNEDVSRFSYYLVGCDQDYEWLTKKFGNERIIMTGMPKLDDIYRIKNEDIDLQPIYDEVGSNSFYLVNAPSDVFSKEIHHQYCNPVFEQSPYKIVYKTHPGHSIVSFYPEITVDTNRYTMIDDNRLDRDYVYKVIKASRGVVIVESFLIMEASFLGKPAIFWGHEFLPQNLYNKPENVNQIYRLPIEMSSTFEKPEYKPKQLEMTQKYWFDGKNTERVVTFLKQL